MRRFENVYRVSVPKTSFESVWLSTNLLRQPELIGFGANPFGDCVRRYSQGKRTTTCSCRECAKGGACLGGNAFVAMMEPANLRDLHDPTHRRKLNRSAYGCVLAQRQVSPRSLIVIEVGLQDAPQTGFIEDDHMIQALAPNRANQALDIGILPGRLWCRENLPNTQPVRRFTELLSVAPVPIS